MSSRALRRLQKERNNEDLINISNENEDNEVVTVNNKNKCSTKNLFELLGNDDDSNKDENVSDNEHSDEKEEEGMREVNNIPSKKSRKKKKNKKKKQSKSPSESVSNDDDIEQSIQEVNKILGIEGSSSPVKEVTAIATDTPFQSRSILAVDPRNLNPDYEMRRKFGASVVQPERRRNPHERTFRRTNLVTPKENWPRFTKVGVKMSAVKNENSSTSVFTFEHQDIYQKIQFLFYDAVESLDHNNIMALLNAHPYHIDSLLQLSEICKINEDLQMAAELIERALYVFECSFHTLFNITTGKCRLEYKRAENRPFYLALFRHLHSMGEKACYRTALEFSKVLLGLDPMDDPLCVFLFIDYYALKSEQYEYFIQLADEFNASRNMLLLPNMAYSYALAKFYHLSEKGSEEADKSLQSAIISFPSLLLELMEKCEVELDAKITSFHLFDKVNYIKQTASISQLNSLYCHRSFSLWKPPEVINWIVQNCLFIIDNSKELENEIQEKKNIRKSRFKSSPRNVLRHIVISDVKEAMRYLPLEVRNQTLLTHDPLPPADSVIGYERPARQRQGGPEGNMLSLFLQSLMPSYNPQAPVHNNDAERAFQEAGAEAAPNPTIQEGATRLMGAMRDLLSAMTYRNDLNPDEQHNNENDGENNDEWNDE